MDIDKLELNETIRLLMRNLGDSQTSVGRVIDLSQPQVGKRLKSPDDDEAVDWSFGELRAIARHWGIPLTTLCAGRTAVMQWLTSVVDLQKCAPWELNAQPAGSGGAAEQLTLLMLAAA